MKHARKLISFLLALTMVFALAAVAFAADDAAETGDGKITITNATANQTYTIYRIFNLSYQVTSEEDAEETTGAYAYTVNDAWKSFFETNATGLNYFDIDDAGYVTAKENMDAAAFAAAAIAFAKDSSNSISDNGTKQASVAKDEETASAVFENLPLGYYLVDSTVGTLCSLHTTAKEVNIVDKNEQPIVEKKVYEDETAGATNDASIGDVVKFTATITAKEGAKNYVFHDKMTAGLTFDDDSVTVKVGETAYTNDENNTYYTVKTDDLEDTESCTFHIEFEQSFLNSITAKGEANTNGGATITISYEATLNANAVIAENGNTNSAHLSYGDNNDLTTTPVTTTTKTWKFDVYKHAEDETEDAAHPLAGATFTLTKKDGNEPIKFVNVKNEDSNITTTWRVAESDTETGAVTEITTDSTGKFTLQGLDSGEYVLTETKAPDGYNKLKDPIAITIDKDGNVSKTAAATEPETQDEYEDVTTDNTIKVENKTGTELPSTGGIGTTIFYIVGAVLVLGAVVLLVTKKRMSAAE